MRVVFLADAPYVHTRRWVTHFAERGWETHVVSFRPAEIPGATVHYVDGLERTGKARYLVHARRVSRLVRELRPDVLHALHLTSYGFLAGLTGCHPAIVSVWGTDVLEAPHLTPVHRWLTRRALARADAITATGLRLAEATLPWAPPAKPVAVIPYGADLERFAPAASSPPRDRVVVGAVARLSPEKGFDHLLQALALLRDRGVRAELRLAGDGPSRAALEKRAAALNLGGHVRFLGEVPHEAVPEILRDLDIFAIPSTWEGFGVAAVEAAACALPVVGSNIHGIPDVVQDGETGLLVPPADPSALAAALEALIADPARRGRMGVAGRALVEREYDWAKNAAQMERLYELACAPVS